MALNAREYRQESKFERPDPLEVGTYPARVVQVVSLGLQKQNPYKGEPKDPKDEIYVTYELLDEFLQDEDGNDIEDKPRWLSETFTMNSLDSDLAKSTKRYYALDPEEKFKGDWSKLIGAACMISVVQNEGKGKNAGTIYNNIASVQTMRAKEEARANDLVNEGKVFDIDEPDMEVFLSLPKFLQDKMKDNLNFGGSALEKAIEAHESGSGSEGAKEAKKATSEADNAAEGQDEGDDEDW